LLSVHFDSRMKSPGSRGGRGRKSGFLATRSEVCLFLHVLLWKWQLLLTRSSKVLLAESQQGLRRVGMQGATGLSRLSIETLLNEKDRKNRVYKALGDF